MLKCISSHTQSVIRFQFKKVFSTHHIENMDDFKCVNCNSSIFPVSANTIRTIYLQSKYVFVRYIDCRNVKRMNNQIIRCDNCNSFLGNYILDGGLPRDIRFLENRLLNGLPIQVNEITSTNIDL